MGNSGRPVQNFREHLPDPRKGKRLTSKKKGTREPTVPGALGNEAPHELITDVSSGKEFCQELPVKFLISSVGTSGRWERTCPSAKTITGFSKLLGEWCIIQLRCKRWGCRHCGERKVARFAWRCEDAHPNRLITLTVAKSRWINPRAAYESTRGMVTQLATKLRRIVDEFEYFRILEVTKSGWPHYHLIVRSGYIPQRVLSRMWNSLTGAPIVDVRVIRKGKRVYFYVMKYLCKQQYVPWTNRRVSWSKNFFQDNLFPAGKPLDLINIGWVDEHPFDVIRRHYHSHFITAYSKDCWTVPEWYGYQIGSSRYGR